MEGEPAQIAQAQSHVERMLAVSLSANDAATADAIDKFNRLAHYARSAVSVPDADLLSGPELADIATRLSLVADAMEAAADGDRPELLVEQINLLVDAVQALRPLRALAPQPDFSEASEAATALRRSTGQLIRRLDEEAKAANAALDEVRQGLDAATTLTESLERRVESGAGRLDQAIAEFQQQFSSTQGQQQSEFNAALLDIRDKLERERATRTEEVERVRRQILEELSEQKREASKQVAEVVAAAVEDARERRAAQEEELSAALDRLTALEGEARAVFTAATNVSLKGAYAAVANEQRDEANRWRWIAISALAIAGLLSTTFVLLHVFGIGSGGVSAVVLKTTLTVAFVGAFGYAAAQSREHRKREEKERRLELELSSLDAYLESVAEESIRDDLRKTIALRIFRGHAEEGGDAAPPPSP